MLLFAQKEISAGEVQAEVYRQLVNDGIKVAVEYKYLDCRFDLVVVKGSQILAIIETKKAPKVNKKYTSVKQLNKYSRFGIPVIYTRGLAQVSETIKEVKKILKSVDKV